MVLQVLHFHQHLKIQLVLEVLMALHHQPFLGFLIFQLALMALVILLLLHHQ